MRVLAATATSARIFETERASHEHEDKGEGTDQAARGHLRGDGVRAVSTRGSNFAVEE